MYCRICGHSAHAASNSLVVSSTCDAVYHKHCKPSKCLCNSPYCTLVAIPITQCCADSCSNAPLEGSMLCSHCTKILRHKLESFLETREVDGADTELLIEVFKGFQEIPQWATDTGQTPNILQNMIRKSCHVCLSTLSFDPSTKLYRSYTHQLIQEIHNSPLIQLSYAQLVTLPSMSKLDMRSQTDIITRLKSYLRRQPEHHRTIHILACGSVRKNTRLMIHNKDTLLRRIIHSGCRGIRVSDIISEYNGAFKDLLSLKDKGKIWLDEEGQLVFSKTLVCEALDGLRNSWNFIKS